MSTQRHGAGNRLSSPEKQQIAKTIPGLHFPIQHKIQELEKELGSFNERIVELEKENHRGHAMDVLKANAMDFARQIDELRSFLIDPSAKSGLHRKT